MSGLLYEELFSAHFDPLNSELNPVCHLLALPEPHHILHVSRVRVNFGNSG